MSDRPRPHHCWLFVGLLAALLLGGPQAAGAGPPEHDAIVNERVLIRVVPSDDQIEARLRAELELLGLTATALEVPEQAPALGPDLLDRLADNNASAAIEIVIGEHRIDLWVADGNTGKSLNRRLDPVLDPEQGDPRTLAIAAVELLRASRLELNYPASQTGGPASQTGEHDSDEPRDDVSEPGEPNPTEQVRERERPPREVELPSLGAISLAPMVGGSPGGFGVTTHVELAGRWTPHKRFGLRFSLWIPTLGNNIQTTDGSVRLFTGMAFVEPQLLLPGGAPWFHPELGLGLGGAAVGFAGTANDGVRIENQVLPGFTSYAHLGFGFAVVPRLWIRLDGYVGVLLPRPEVKSLMGETEATWGAPFATGSLGLEIRL